MGHDTAELVCGQGSMIQLTSDWFEVLLKFLDDSIPLGDGEVVKMSTKTRGPCVGLWV